MSRSALLKSFRIIHLYFGVFITPALIFFAFTGALQTFGLHETSRDHPDWKPARWIVVLGQLHKKQTTIVSARRPQPPSAASKPEPRPAEGATPPSSQYVPPVRHPLPLRIFFLVVCIGLFTSTITGLCMSYAYIRNKALVTATLVAGIVLPIPLIFI